jgi:cytidylate kinase
MGRVNSQTKGAAMKTASRSIQKIIEDQFKKWRADRPKIGHEPLNKPVLTVSREPGSGGSIVAKKVAEDLGLDLFHQEIVHEMANSAKVSEKMFETLDEKRLNTLENWISSLVDARHLWPDKYLEHLMRIIGIIGHHGCAVIVGRGANFILPPESRLRVRVIAPLENRVKHVSDTFSVPATEAKRRIIRTESERKAFVRNYFNADISAPENYDMVVNTGTMSIEKAAETIATALAS